MINWNVSNKNAELIGEIAERFLPENRLGIVMDLTACHANGCPLRLQDLLEAREVDLIHDVYGINRNMDQKTGKLRNGFLPRFAK